VGYANPSGKKTPVVPVVGVTHPVADDENLAVWGDSNDGLTTGKKASVWRSGPLSAIATVVPHQYIGRMNKKRREAES